MGDTAAATATATATVAAMARATATADTDSIIAQDTTPARTAATATDGEHPRACNCQHQQVCPLLWDSLIAFGLSLTI